ncbi:MAG: PPC domain-containing protein [Planctomycetes bacterium]|nr:PPC domain-containing protein [Planctomycetota bacterium]
MTISSLRLLTIGAAFAAGAIAQNDACSGAIALLPGSNGPFSNVGSTLSAPAWPCGSIANDVWFTFQAAANGTVTVDTCGASIDTVLQVFQGSCNSLVSIGCNDDGCGTASTLTFPVVGYDVYKVRVAGYGGVTGSFPVRLQGPVIGSYQAYNVVNGLGCIRNPASFYEQFPGPTVDLSNSSITMIPSGGGYFVTQSTPTFHAPSAAAIVLPLGDDNSVSVPLASPLAYPGGTTSVLDVCSNGFVAMATGNSPTTLSGPGMINQPATAYFVTSDYDPSILFGGRVKYELVAGKHCVTWDGVWAFAGNASTARTFQIQFDTTNGNVHYVFQGLNTVNGLAVGYSPGGSSYDNGSMDISAAVTSSFQLPAVDGLPLTVTPVTRPIVGGTWTMDVTNFPATSAIGFDIIGLSDPGIDDLVAIGMPGCSLRSSLDVLSSWAPGGAAHSYSIGIPPIPALIGQQIHTSSAVFVPGINAFGAITGNGVTGHMGDW